LQRFDPHIKELVEVVEELLSFSRAGTFDETPGEWEAVLRAEAALAFYKPADASTSSTNGGSDS
jgi:hypothetical protein